MLGVKCVTWLERYHYMWLYYRSHESLMLSIIMYLIIRMLTCLS